MLMSDVKWIKITTDIFDDEKILLIESLPDADAIIVIWFKLLCLAGKMNNSGVFMMNNRIAFTDKMLATIFRRKESTVQLALSTFASYGMIEVIDDVITIPNWGKHQNLDSIEIKNEYMREYMKEYRKKQKKLTGNNKLCENGLSVNDWKAVLDYFNHECAYCGSKEDLEQEHIVPVSDGGTYAIGNIVPACRKCNASKGNKNLDDWYRNSGVFDSERLEKLYEYRRKTNVNGLRKTNVSSLEREVEEDRELELDTEGEKEKNNIITTCKQVVSMYHKICISYPSVKVINEDRKKAIKARLKTYSLDDFKALFEKAEASAFLKGGNDRNWSADFDWLIKDSSMAKVLEGKYDNRSGVRNQAPNKTAQQLDDFYDMAARWAAEGE
nr:MAG TPA: replisome organizer [Caudoviricetes sp.]